jgi:hypothetical protein
MKPAAPKIPTIRVGKSIAKIKIIEKIPANIGNNNSSLSCFITLKLNLVICQLLENTPAIILQRIIII